MTPAVKLLELSPYALGMLHVACNDHRRIYVGRKGCELVGYRSGRWWTALWLWWLGYLRRDGKWHTRGYGAPACYLVVTQSGRARAQSGGR